MPSAIDFVRSRCGNINPEWGLVLGSGLDGIVQEMRNPVSIPYSEIPGFSAATVSGHQGKFYAGKLFGKPAVILAGRPHYYEGRSMEEVVFPARLLSLLGCKNLLLTAAVGGINRKLKVGDLVIVSDHINFMGANPLRGIHDPSFGERFPDLSACYCEALRKKALALAKKNKIRAFSGVYLASAGPSYETPAEISAFARLGADVAGMSVVPEAIAAHQMGMEVLALCFVSNFAAGISKTPLNHEEVLAAGKSAAGSLSLLIREILQK